MTKAEILAGVRYLVNELSTDSGALLDDAGNLDDFVEDAQEQVVLDLVNVMPDVLVATEDLDLAAHTATTTITATYWQIINILKNKTGETPNPIRIVDPSDQRYFHYIDQEDEEPSYCYVAGQTITWLPKPSSTYDNYAKLYYIRPEAVTMPTEGPTYLPAVAHRLVVYQAAILAGTAFGAIISGLEKLYARRLMSVKKTWSARFHSQPRFVKASVFEGDHDDREAAFYDDSHFFDA